MNRTYTHQEDLKELGRHIRTWTARLHFVLMLGEMKEDFAGQLLKYWMPYENEILNI